MYRVTRKSRGIALIQYKEAGDAVAAHGGLDGSIFLGRLLHVLPARRPPQLQPVGQTALPSPTFSLVCKLHPHTGCNHSLQNLMCYCLGGWGKRQQTGTRIECGSRQLEMKAVYRAVVLTRESCCAGLSFISLSCLLASVVYGAGN